MLAQEVAPIVEKVAEEVEVVTTNQLMDEITDLGGLLTVAVILLVLIGIALMLGLRRIARNQVEMAGLLKQKAPEAKGESGGTP